MFCRTLDCGAARHVRTLNFAAGVTRPLPLAWQATGTEPPRKYLPKSESTF